MSEDTRSACKRPTWKEEEREEVRDDRGRRGPACTDVERITRFRRLRNVKRRNRNIMYFVASGEMYFMVCTKLKYFQRRPRPHWISPSPAAPPPLPPPPPPLPPGRRLRRRWRRAATSSCVAASAAGTRRRGSGGSRTGGRSPPDSGPGSRTRGQSD